jgi:arginase family enzyme
MTSAWPNLSDLLVAATDAAPIGLIGAPLAKGSVTAGRCDLAPAELRKVLRRIGRFDIDRGHELRSRIADDGDLPVAELSIEDATAQIVHAVAENVERHALTLLIGGNNAVTRPGVHGIARAVGAPLDRVGLITIDAHFDMRDTSGGLGNGNPVRALLEDGLPGRNIAQIGLAAFANSKAMHSDAVQAGNRVITLAEFEHIGWEGAVEHALEGLASCDVLVVDCDIDVIDRSQFPAAPGARPAGMQARDFFAVARRLAAEPRVALIDLTEWDPPLDPSDLSSLVAGRWLAEVLSGFESRA